MNPFTSDCRQEQVVFSESSSFCQIITKCTRSKLSDLVIFFRESSRSPHFGTPLQNDTRRAIDRNLLVWCAPSEGHSKWIAPSVGHSKCNRTPQGLNNNTLQPFWRSCAIRRELLHGLFAHRYQFRQIARCRKGFRSCLISLRACSDSCAVPTVFDLLRRMSGLGS